jgi:predicted DsbA family dithiol-disulfide isomerase
MAALARAQGQPYAIHHPVASSFDAHRMLHLAAEHGAASEFMDAVQRDLLGEGVNVYTAAYLANAATRAGVPAARPATARPAPAPSRRRQSRHPARRR